MYRPPLFGHGATTIADPKERTLTDPTVTVVTGGVDTHLDLHVAAALDQRGAHLGTRSFPATPAGYRQLLGWLGSFGNIGRVGGEGTGAYGAGLARHLAANGVLVIEVDRPNPRDRRRNGKSDPLDAVSAAPAAQSGEASSPAKERTGNVEAIRALRVGRRGAQSDRVRAINQLRSLVTTAPDDLRQALRRLPRRDLIATCAAFRPRRDIDVLTATKHAMREIARRIIHLEAEIARLDDLLGPIVTATAPELVELHGVGVDTAGALLVAAGDRPDRLHSRGSFARLCGAAPLPASSGKLNGRHRVNKGGNRQANSALWRIVLIRMRSDPRTRRYVERRTAEAARSSRSCDASRPTSPARSTPTCPASRRLTPQHQTNNNTPPDHGKHH